MIDWLACTLVRVLGAVLRLLPPEAGSWLGEQLGGLAGWAQGKRARIGEANLRAAFGARLAPGEDRRMIRRCFRQFGAAVIEMLRVPVIDEAYVRRYVAFEGLDRIDRARAAGRPVVLLTAHFGNWEMTSIAGALRGYQVVALARFQNKLPRLYALLIAYRESKGCIIVHKGGAMRTLIRALEERKLVGIVGDQASRQGMAVEFFGRPALFAMGPFELARSSGAVILPVFMHRVRGPHHRLVIEPPIELPSHAPKDEAVRAGVEQFAEVLTRHILEDPSQWLWMHKRWKHTTARRLLVLSDGKAGHVKQAVAIAQSVAEARPGTTHAVVPIRYRSGVHRAAALLWSWWLPGVDGHRCLRWALTPDSAQALLTSYADLVLSCGSSLIPANLLWARANRAKSVVLMNPAPLPLNRFDLVIAPRHDGLPKRPKVLEVAGALSRMREEELSRAGERLRAHPGFRPGAPVEHAHPVAAVLIGGDTAHYELSGAFADALASQVASACARTGAWCVATTSRRTSAEAERVLEARLGREACCRLLLLASRDQLDGTMEGLLGSADAVVVTGESVSMVSEACASGRIVIVVEPPRRPGAPAKTKHRRFLDALAAERYVQVVPPDALAGALALALTERRPAKKLEDLQRVVQAVNKLL